MNGRLWTAADDELLEELYGTLTVEQIGKKMGRSVAAIHARAGKLRLGPRRPAGSLSGKELQAAIGLDWHQILRWVHTGELKATRHADYGRRDRPVWVVLEQDLIAFLKTHPHVVDRDEIDPAYRQFVSERWITFVEAFRRGAAFVNLLENAVKAGLIPEARQRGDKGTRWAIPESLLPSLVAARKRMTTDEEHRRLVRLYDRIQARGALQRRASYLRQKARAAASGGRSKAA